ncbi:MAG: M67 family metallopeptidase [Acidobacteriota bacterium]
MMSDAADPPPDTVDADAPVTASLRLTPAQRAELEAWCADAYPDEGCGLLIGPPSAPAGDGRLTYRVRRVTRARNLNVARARDRYVLDPADFLAADRAARADGLDVVGIWHTHPDHPPRPSITDLEAAWDGYVYLIVRASADAVGPMRAWQLGASRRFVELDVETDAGAAAADTRAGADASKDDALKEPAPHPDAGASS